MKKGKSYISVNSQKNINHPLVKLLLAKGFNKYFKLTYASHWSTDAGWTVTEDHGNCLPTWLGFTIEESIKTINETLI